MRSQKRSPDQDMAIEWAYAARSETCLALLSPSPSHEPASQPAQAGRPPTHTRAHPGLIALAARRGLCLAASDWLGWLSWPASAPASPD